MRHAVIRNNSLSSQTQLEMTKGNRIAQQQCHAHSLPKCFIFSRNYPFFKMMATQSSLTNTKQRP